MGSSFRAQLSAAPLKQNALTQNMLLIVAFRAQLSAAPLKRMVGSMLMLSDSPSALN